MQIKAEATAFPPICTCCFSCKYNPCKSGLVQFD